jgi:hypothetical protein
MKQFFAITVFVLVACSPVFGDQPSDERELAQLVKDLNTAIVKPDIAFLEQVLDQDYTHYRPHGNIENRAQYLESRKSGRVDFASLVADDIKSRLLHRAIDEADGPLRSNFGGLATDPARGLSLSR